MCSAVENQLNEICCSFCKMPKFAANISNKIFFKEGKKERERERERQVRSWRTELLC